MVELRARAFTVPADEPESDGMLAWDATTIVVVHASAGGTTGLGYTYAPAAAAALVADVLAGVARDADPLTPQRTWAAMRAALRNAVQAGLGAMALSAADLGLHDLRARRLGPPLARALGGARDAVEVYGSGGFTSYSLDRLAEQLGGWVRDGIRRVFDGVPGPGDGRLAPDLSVAGNGLALRDDAEACAA